MDLPAPIARLGNRIYQTSAAVGLAVQRGVLWFLLVNLYVFGLGLTRLTAVFFGRRYLTLYDSEPADTYWKDAEGYTADRDRLEAEY